MGHLNVEIEIPPHCKYLIDWFWDVSSTRQFGFSGPQRLSIIDVASWVASTGNILTREDLVAIREMDTAYLNAVAEEQKASEARNTND